MWHDMALRLRLSASHWEGCMWRGCVTVEHVEHDTGQLEARRSAGVVSGKVRRGRRHVKHRHERVGTQASDAGAPSAFRGSV